jgi:Protein of unknown function (DUF5818)
MKSWTEKQLNTFTSRSQLSLETDYGTKREKKTEGDKSMRKLFLLVAPVILVFSTVGFAAAKDFSGEIMDSSCAKMGSHEGMMKGHPGIKDAKGCTLGCVKGGAKFVLYDASSKTVYQLDDQKKPMDFAGEKVQVSGTLDEGTSTIHVADIKR